MAKRLHLAWVGLFVAVLAVVALMPTAVEYAVMAGLAAIPVD
jgi:hypothetical protein